MSPSLDQAAANHTTIKVTSRTPPVGRLMYQTKNEVFTVDIVNAGVAYSAEQAEEFYEMLMVLKEEGKIGPSGSMPIANLLKM